MINELSDFMKNQNKNTKNEGNSNEDYLWLV